MVDRSQTMVDKDASVCDCVTFTCHLFGKQYKSAFNVQDTYSLCVKVLVMKKVKV